MKDIARYFVVTAMVIAAMLGIPIIFPNKANPYNGKSVGEKPSLDIKG